MPTSNIKHQISNRVSRLTLFVLHFMLYAVLGSCKTYWPTEARTFEPSLAIEALLVDGQPVDSVWVRLSYGILESQPKTQKVYDSAFIVVYTGSKSDTLAAKDSLPNCFQASDANFMVRTGETYYLYAEIYNAEVETLKVRARTTVPDSFSCVPLASVWLADTTKAAGFKDYSPRDLFSFFDPKTLQPILMPVAPNDTIYYTPDSVFAGLWNFSILNLLFYDFYDETLGDSLFNIMEQYAPLLGFNFARPQAPGPEVGGVLIEYEWGRGSLGNTPWEDLQFFMQKGFDGMYDSSGYYYYRRTTNSQGAIENDPRALSFAFTTASIVKYVGESAFNIYALDNAAWDWQQTRREDKPETNIEVLYPETDKSVDRGIFGSASVYRYPFYFHVTENLITNGEAKAIADRRREED